VIAVGLAMSWLQGAFLFGVSKMELQSGGTDETLAVLDC
jgi:hypothetical protein